jgi:alpha-beta hydrolase superfamily lysophospholipase
MPHGINSKLKNIKWLFIIKGVLIVLLVTPVVLLISFAPVFGLFNCVVFRASTEGNYSHLDAFGIIPIDTYFQSDSGAKLHGLFYKLPNAKRVILISHGNGGNISGRAHLADLLLRTGNSVFAYDYAGYGHSQGNPSLLGFVQDANSAYKYLLDQKYKPKQIILLGESLGTCVTAELAQTHDCAAIILECPLYSLRRRGCAIFPFLRIYPNWAWMTPEVSYDNAIALQKSHPPLLLVAGTIDKQTPINESDELFSAVSEPKTYIRIDGASHGDRVMMSSPAYKLGLAGFLKSLN